MKRKVSLFLVMVLLICCFSHTPVTVLAYDGAKPLPVLTGVQSEDVAQIALSQVGYCKNDGTVYGAWWNQVTNWGSDYTYSHWCAMFACWCADQAGAGLNVAFNKSSARVINLFNFICKTGSYDTTFQTEPRPGDFIFFRNGDATLTLPHVAVITAYDSATKEITYVGGNQYLNASYNSAVTVGYCKWEYGAKPRGENLYVYGYGRPAYNNSTSNITSTTPIITSDKSVYNVGENVILQRNIVRNSNFHWITLWHDGEQILSTGMDNINYVLSDLKAGSYDVYLQVGNATGSDMASCSFVVQDAGTSNQGTNLGSTPVISSDKYAYNVGENVVLQRNTVQNSNFHWITLWHDGEQILSTGMDNVNYVLSNLKVGFYDVFLQVGNATDSDQTAYSFVVQDTSNQSTSLSSHPVITTDKKVYAGGENVVLQRNTVQNADYHWIRLWHNGEQILSTGIESTHVLTDLKTGSYDLYLQVGNGVDKEIANCTFTVQESSVNDNASVNEQVSVHNHEDYIIDEEMIEPTCKEEGSRTYQCSYCGESIVERIPAIEHDFSRYEVEQTATFDESGIAYFACLNCDEAEEVDIPKVKEAVLSKYEYTYNGKRSKPNVTVTDAEGNKLVQGTDYSVKYKGNGKSVGQSEVIITLKGDYSGTKSLYYYVMPKAPKKAKAVDKKNDVIVSWKKSVGADGYYVYSKESKNDTYTKIGSTNKLTYTKKNLKQEVEYEFKIVPYYTVNQKICLSDNEVVVRVKTSKNK